MGVWGGPPEDLLPPIGRPQSAARAGAVTPALSQTGEYARLQVTEGGSTRCVHPALGEELSPGTSASGQCE